MTAKRTCEICGMNSDESTCDECEFIVKQFIAGGSARRLSAVTGHAVRWIESVIRKWMNLKERHERN